MTRRISSSIVFRTQAVHSACGLLTLSASAVVLAPIFCFGCCQALDSLSATSIAVCLNCGFIALRSTAFVHPVAFVLLLKRFLDNMHLVFQLGSFLFLCGFPRHLLYLCDLASIVSARTWFSLSSHPSPSTPRPSWTCACTRRGPLNLERAVECSSLRFRAVLHPRIS